MLYPIAHITGHRKEMTEGKKKITADNTTPYSSSETLSHMAHELNPFAASLKIEEPHFHTLNLLRSLFGSSMATTSDAQSQWEFSCDVEVDYGSEEKASIVYTALAVDKELQPDKVKRLMTVSNRKLSVLFEAIEARFLRASFSAFVDVLTLATKTIEEFGQEMEL